MDVMHPKSMVPMPVGNDRYIRLLQIRFCQRPIEFVHMGSRVASIYGKAYAGAINIRQHGAVCLLLMGIIKNPAG